MGTDGPRCREKKREWQHVYEKRERRQATRSAGREDGDGHWDCVSMRTAAAAAAAAEGGKGAVRPLRGSSQTEYKQTKRRRDLALLTRYHVALENERERM